jgi:hypothetical protein
MVVAEAVKIDTSIYYCTYRITQQKHPGRRRRRILNGSTEMGFIADNKNCIESGLLFWPGQFVCFNHATANHQT